MTGLSAMLKKKEEGEGKGKGTGKEISQSSTFISYITTLFRGVCKTGKVSLSSSKVYLRLPNCKGSRIYSSSMKFKK